MNILKKKFGVIVFGVLSSAIAMIPGITAQAAEVTHDAYHAFSINDVQGGFNGIMYAAPPELSGLSDSTILCGLGTPCPVGVGENGEALPQPTPMKLPDNATATLYPINSEFGFKVSDFVGAAQKELTDTVDDGSGSPVIYYGEGFIGNVPDDVGVAISNASTELFKVKPPMGTWCAGLGATSVKCSTEHYTVLEHVKTCYETIPYMFAETDGTQGTLIDPATGLPVGTCDLGRLDNVLYEVTGGVVGTTPMEPVDGQVDLPANESTILNDIAVTNDYAVTKKDDGKPLYRWGDLVKRPNDVRLYAKMALPQVWKDNPENEYVIKSAYLWIRHTITNNPNDQIRPEDMENEGATGTLPSHAGVGDSTWTSTKDCYEGDGHFIPTGTVLRNAPFQLGDSDTNPYPYSSDLREGLTNAWYTTTDRDPFAFDPVSGMGPRWRLLPNKFGQDIPGLEIPLVECSPVPFSSGNIRYPTGESTHTVINLLDFEDDASPLRRSSGWIDNAANFQNLCPEIGENPPASGVCDISVNGLPMTDDFDLAIYVKGDKKPAVVNAAYLEIVYDDVPLSPTLIDGVLKSLIVPDVVDAGTTANITGTYANEGTVPFSGNLELYYGGYIGIGGVWETTPILHTIPVVDLAPGTTASFSVELEVSEAIPDGQTIYWFANLVPSAGDDNRDNNWTVAPSLVNNP